MSMSRQLRAVHDGGDAVQDGVNAVQEPLDDAQDQEPDVEMPDEPFHGTSGSAGMEAPGQPAEFQQAVPPWYGFLVGFRFNNLCFL